MWSSTRPLRADIQYKRYELLADEDATWQFVGQAITIPENVEDVRLYIRVGNSSAISIVIHNDGTIAMVTGELMDVLQHSHEVQRAFTS